MDGVKRIWYLSPMRAAKVQASLRIRAVSPEPPLLAHTGSESRGTFRQKARSLAPLNGWACAVKMCHDGMLEDTNSLDGAHIILIPSPTYQTEISLYKNRQNLISFAYCNLRKSSIKVFKTSGKTIFHSLSSDALPDKQRHQKTAICEQLISAFVARGLDSLIPLVSIPKMSRL